jgi:murein DD-endopeptidase MepM/ murein hydrolase activator NlpD
MTPRRSLSRRSVLIGGVATLAAAAAARSTGAGASATLPEVTGAASVSEPAERLGTTTTTAPTTTTPAPEDDVAYEPNEHGLIFPMASAPTCSVLKNFGDGRSGGRSHQGIDILATEGQAVYAVIDGTITDIVREGDSNSSLSGNLIDLTGPDDTYFVYAHLSGFAEGLEVGTEVVQGQVIGYVGDTGNPGPGNYHLHFEVHPEGGSAIDPMNVLTIPEVCNVW